MKFNLVVYEDKSWILKKFADEIKNELEKKKHEVFQDKWINQNCEINIHFDHSMIDMGEIKRTSLTLHAVMITHIVSLTQLRKLIYLSKCEHVKFFTMSNWTFYLLRKVLYGEDNMNFILPPYNSNNNQFKLSMGVNVNIGIFSNYYNDGRKNENFIFEAIGKVKDEINGLNFFIFGNDWEFLITNELVDEYKKVGVNFILLAQKEFCYESYKETLDNMDYYLYLGHDEGSMSFLDAIYFKKKIIAIPQGFQHDLFDFITYPFYDSKELSSIFTKIVESENKLKIFKDKQTWANYTVGILDLIQKNPVHIKWDLIKKLRYMLFKKNLIKKFTQTKNSWIVL